MLKGTEYHENRTSYLNFPCHRRQQRGALLAVFAATSRGAFVLCLPGIGAMAKRGLLSRSGRHALFDDADLIALRSSLFLLGVADIDAALAGLQLQAQQALAACGAAKAA